MHFKFDKHFSCFTINSKLKIQISFKIIKFNQIFFISNLTNKLYVIKLIG